MDDRRPRLLLIEDDDRLAPVSRCALVVYNDVLGAEVLAGVHSTGVAVGEDVAVVSYDNSPMSGNPRISLTTVDISPRAMGELAVQAILGNAKPRDGLLISPHELVIRASSVSSSPG